MNGQDAEQDGASLLREFTPTAPRALDQPFKGSIQVVWPRDGKGAKPESLILNFMSPADGHKGHSPIDTPYLATTEDGSSYWGAVALRRKLPDTNKLTSLSSYKEIVDLLGAPTHLPLSGETDDKMAYDTVSWRLFSPLDINSIEILEVIVFRKTPLGGAPNNKYLIESYSVRRGTLTKNEQGGADQPATTPEQEGNQNPTPESETRPR